MKDLIQLILQYVPQYLNDLGSLVYRPKRFIAAKNPQTDETFVAALVFLVISLIISQIMMAPLLKAPQKDVWSAVARSAVTSVVVIFISSVSLRVAWGLVGGKASTKSLFVVSAYYNAAWLLIFDVIGLIGIGAFKVLNPELYEKGVKGMSLEEQWKIGTNNQMTGSDWVIFIIYWVGFIYMVWWIFIGWGAFVKINMVGRVRSFFAAMLSLMFDIPLLALAYFINVAEKG
jgi:hypothetical protein